jgi:hypothetical protein
MRRFSCLLVLIVLSAFVAPAVVDLTRLKAAL